MQQFIIKSAELLPIPIPLEAIVSDTEEIMNNIYAADWEQAKSKVNSIKSNMEELIPILQQALVPNNLILEMQQQIKELEQNVMTQNTKELINKANRITMYIPDILDYFKVIIPTDVNRLDYLGRQIIIDVDSNNWNEASQNFVEVKKIWENLKSKINTKYDKDTVTFDIILKNLGEAIDTKNYPMTVDTANTMLDNVDQLKTIFKEQNT